MEPVQVQAPLNAMQGDIKQKLVTSIDDGQTSRVWISFDRLSRILHCSCAVIFVGIWIWHCTPEAQKLPGFVKFGWFFRYLTFCSFTLETLWLILCTIQWIIPDDQNKLINAITDDMACALFPLTTTVTILYYTLETVTHNLNEGGRNTSPPWLNFSVHIFNSITLWLDLIFAKQRSFSVRSKILSFVFATGYFGWILVVKFLGGSFPYPFLEDLSFPSGFLIFCVSAIAMFSLLYIFGNFLRRMVEARVVVVQVKQPVNRGFLFWDISGAALAAALAIYIFK